MAEQVREAYCRAAARADRGRPHRAARSAGTNRQRRPERQRWCAGAGPVSAAAPAATNGSIAAAAAVAHADPPGHDDAPLVDDPPVVGDAEAAPGLGEAATAAAAGNGDAAADVLPGAKIWAERPLWRAFFLVWLHACLQVVRRKYSELTTDSLPEGRGELLHLTGQA